MDTIHIRGARTHNLKNIELKLPRDKLIVITGLSGSGKSSLAFDTLYAEGQRRYVESLSAYARQFLSMMEKPDVDHIEGLSPAISIEQKAASHNPRSTVGTITEIHDYLRLLYARVGQPRCPEHGITLQTQTISQMVDAVLALPLETKIMILAPIIQDRKGEHLQVIEQLRSQGFVRARIDGKVYELDEAPPLALRKKHTIEVIIDRIKIRPDLELRLAESFETAQSLADGIVKVAMMEKSDQPDMIFSAKFSCPLCGYSLAELEPRLFSFNNPNGACKSCDGLGVKQFFDPERIVHDTNISLAAGAVRGWDRRNAYYYSMLQSLAEHYGFDTEIPYNKLPKKIKDIILFGSKEEEIVFRYLTGSGKIVSRAHAFEGVMNIMDRRYHETDSSLVREDLAKYLTTKACQECFGARLCKEARYVFVADKSLPEISASPIKEALDFFETLSLPGHRGEIAAKVKKELCSRLGFLVNV